MLGFDPRVQLLHEDDALEVLRLATHSGRPGTVNVGGAGVLLLSQMVAPGRAGAGPGARAARVSVVGGLVRRAGLLDFSPEQLQLPGVRPGGGHDPAAHRVRLHARGTTRVAAFDDVVRAPRAGDAGASRPRYAGPRARSSTRSGRPRSAGSARGAPMGDARVIPLHGDGDEPPPAAGPRRPGRRAPEPRTGRTGSAGSPAAWPSCAAGSPATTRSTSSASTATSPLHVLAPPFRPLYEKWFRVEASGLHNVPATGGALVVANHSGTLPLDAVMTALALLDHHPAHRHLRMLGADLVFRTPGARPAGPQVRADAGLQPGRRAAAR